MKAAKQSVPASIEGVSAVERALKVLTAYRRGDRALSLVELAHRTGLIKSTIMRLAASLEDFGLLARTGEGAYRLDAECLRLGSLYQTSFELADHIRPALERLVNQTGETASFYVRRGDQRLCLFRQESQHRLRLHVQPGDTRPMDKSAIAETLRRYQGGLPAEGLDADVPLFTSGATDIHVAAMAMPVFGNGNVLMGALAISGPVTRLTAEVARSHRDELRSAGQALTWLCGGSARPVAGASQKKQNNVSKMIVTEE